MQQALKTIGEIGIVPVVVIENAGDAVPLCKALMDGGLPIAEITFRTAAAEEAIRNVAAELPEVVLGAGTVLTTDQARRAVDAGAQFVVSPGFDPQVVRFCIENKVPITPGCSSPTDIGMAVAMGLEVVKFFPAEASGGIKTLKAISAPYGMVKFIPTGGINAGNLSDYLSFGKVLACGGSWMVKPDLIKAGNFEEITRLAREAVATMLGFEIAHVGINTGGADESLSTAKTLASMFNMPVKEGNSSNFAGTAFEVMKEKGPGANGHIAIRTNSLPRAIAYLGRMGVEVDMTTAKGDPMVAVYLKDQVGGFAFHLLQKK
ncbi:MAG: bifunctional 4-hydroxy-2-oxoglutarate aldolase/2-dehydro-3-deoxy-phosphogluconate aldolase [Armatimonadetes bacterium]|nr:bifunctional 4-hydroxy-2-oxoglutarate aldolase/2-dehydro-3-deoxy-phosphogluconate aldolase [Armatimonadota bacterium]